MPIAYWILIALALGFPIAYKLVASVLIAPIMVHRRQTLAMRPNLQYATAEHFTHELSQMLQSALPQFRTEGFESAAMTCNAGSVPNVRSVVATLVNRSTHDVAVIIGTWGTATRSLVYAIRSEFADDTIVSTGVNRGIGVYPRNPAEDSVGFSRLPSIHALCEFHRRRLRHLGVDHKPRQPIPRGSEIARFEREWEHTTFRFVRRRYMYLDPSANVFRYTWKGAFLCTWRLVQPIKRWRIKLRDRRALALWRLLDMPGHPQDAPAPFPPSAAAAGAAGPAPGQIASSDSSNLGYEVALKEGEIRLDSTADGLTVRMGAPTVLRYLARRWYSLLWMLFCAVSFSWLLLRFWLLRRFAARAGLPIGLSFVQVPLIVLSVLFALDLFNLIRSVVILHGTTVLTASSWGLTYCNIPALKRSGHIARDELRGLRVGLRRGGFRSHHAIYALRENASPLPLLVAHDPIQLEQVRSALAQSLGIESPV